MAARWRSRADSTRATRWSFPDRVRTRPGLRRAARPSSARAPGPDRLQVPRAVLRVEPAERLELVRRSQAEEALRGERRRVAEEPPVEHLGEPDRPVAGVHPFLHPALEEAQSTRDDRTSGDSRLRRQARELVAPPPRFETEAPHPIE